MRWVVVSASKASLELLYIPVAGWCMSPRLVSGSIRAVSVGGALPSSWGFDFTLGVSI